jgi:hypothetical protein
MGSARETLLEPKTETERLAKELMDMGGLTRVYAVATAVIILHIDALRTDIQELTKAVDKAAERITTVMRRKP